METTLGLLALMSLILLVLGLISPSKSLFWLTGNRTRLKSSIIYGALFFLFGLVGSQLYPTDKLKNQKEDPGITEQKIEANQPQSGQHASDKLKEEEAQPQNENVAKWLSLSSDEKEGYIKKKIKGKWFQIFHIGFYHENDHPKFEIIKDYKFEYKSTNDKVEEEEFSPSDGFFDHPHFNSVSYGVKGKTEFKTSWMVDGDQIVFAAGLPEETKEKVLYISENLCKRKLIEPNTGFEIVSYYTKLNDESSADYQDELNSLTALDMNDSYAFIKQSVSALTTSTNFDSFKNIFEAYKMLGFTLQLTPENKLQDNEVVKVLSSELAKIYPPFEGQFIKTFDSEVKVLKASESKSSYLEQYDSKIETLKGLKIITNAFHLDNSKLKNEIKKHENSYRKTIAELALYGDMDNFFMKQAVENYLEENVKDPSSLKIVDNKTGLIGKTKKGLAYQVVYRAKNSFGALVLESQRLLLKWSPENKIYYVSQRL